MEHDIRDNWGMKIGTVDIHIPSPHYSGSGGKGGPSISVLLTPVIVTAILIYWGHDYASNYRSLSGLYRYVAEYYFLLGSALRFLHWLTTLFNFTSRPNLDFVLMCASLLIVAFAVYWPLRILFMRSRKAAWPW